MAISGTDLLEVPTVYKVYFLGLCKGISKIWPEKWYSTYLHQLDPEILIDDNCDYYDYYCQFPYY